MTSNIEHPAVFVYNDLPDVFRAMEMADWLALESRDEEKWWNGLQNAFTAGWRKYAQTAFQDGIVPLSVATDVMCLFSPPQIVSNMWPGTIMAARPPKEKRRVTGWLDEEFFG